MTYQFAMERSTIFKNGKPSINGPFSSIFHGYVKEPEGIYDISTSGDLNVCSVCKISLAPDMM
jgi:hypothetical protein